MLKFKDFAPFVEKREGAYAKNPMEGFEKGTSLRELGGMVPRGPAAPEPGPLK